MVLLNTVTLAATLLVNYLAGTGAIGGQTVGQVSRELDTLITPAGYAFSIWGFIYVWLIAFLGFQWHTLLNKRYEVVVDECGTWFMLANVLNLLWVLAWLNRLFGLSVIIMVALLMVLSKLVVRHKLEVWDAPVPIIVFVWWPVSFYFGWIVLATVVNIAAFLAGIGWGGEPFSPGSWAVIMIVVAAAVYLWLIRRRNMREAAAAGMWGLVAIAWRRWDTHGWVALTALVAVFVLAVVAIGQAYRNRRENALWRAVFQKTGNSDAG